MVPEGSTVTFTATSDTGYVVDKWYVNGVHQSGFDGQAIVSSVIDFGGSLFVSFREEATSELLIERPAVDPYITSESSVQFAGTAPVGNHHVTWENLSTGQSGDTGSEDINSTRWSERIDVDEGINSLVFKSWGDAGETVLLGTTTFSVERSTDIRVATATGPIESFVWSADPTQEFPGENVYVGWDDTLGGGFEWAYVQFDLPQLPAGSTIESATFIAEDNGGVGSAPLTIDVNQVIEPWSESTVNWNNKSNVISNDKASTDVSLDEHVEWNVSAIVDRWYSGDDNYGFRMRAPDVGTSSTHDRRFEDQDFELEITYRIETTPPLIDIEVPTDQEEYWTNTSTIHLEGDAHDTKALSQVSWYNHDGNTSGIATGTSNWMANIPLAAGTNLLEVQAEDESGNRASDFLTAYYIVAPQGISASTDMQTQVLTQWNPVEGASFYRVYRSDSDVGTRNPISGWTDAIEFTDTNITLGNSYYYWITAAADAIGSAESQFSSFAVGSTPTPSTPSADFDDDGDTDGADFLAWQRGFGTLTPNATKSEGDADNDQDVDSDDLNAWEAQFGTSLGINDELIAYYPFDGDVDDASGSGKHGAEFGGVTFVPGVDGQAGSFDGVDDYVQFPALDNGSKTFSYWFQSTCDTGPCRILSYDGGYFQDLWVNWIYNGKLSMAGREITSGNVPQLDGTSAVNDGQWHHAAVTLDADTNAINLYVDGTLEASSNQLTAELTMFDHEFYAMWDNFNSGSPLFTPGLLDEVKIWDRALSAAEVALLSVLPATAAIEAISDGPTIAPLLTDLVYTVPAVAAATTSGPAQALAATSPEAQAATNTPQPLYADLVDAAIAVGPASRSKAESRLGSPVLFNEDNTDWISHSSRWSQEPEWQGSSEIANRATHGFFSKDSDDRLYRNADDDAVNQELLDELFADGEFNSLL